MFQSFADPKPFIIIIERNLKEEITIQFWNKKKKKENIAAREKNLANRMMAWEWI